jgi:acyl-CoA synthetase (NDP forming)
VRDDNQQFTDDSRWHGLAPAALIDEAIHELAATFHRHTAFLRPVVLISSVHPEIYRRGAIYSREVGDQFTALLLSTRQQITQPDPETAISAVFNTVFSSLVLRTMYGPGFATPADDDDTFVTTLSAMAQRYLLGSDNN